MEVVEAEAEHHQESRIVTTTRTMTARDPLIQEATVEAQLTATTRMDIKWEMEEEFNRVTTTREKPTAQEVAQDPQFKLITNM